MMDTRHGKLFQCRCARVAQCARAQLTALGFLSLVGQVRFGSAPYFFAEPLPRRRSWRVDSETGLTAVYVLCCAVL